MIPSESVFAEVAHAKSGLSSPLLESRAGAHEFNNEE